ncbi:phosphotransferase family protein [Actinacidiphila paucisporea]|uniref:Predicted kinase, aminoglycoside phosphotransferase (APT) family n=1 Tax=Actinacidiphila paucisporea TaxID=310782 RepID=A0A1M7AM65_9ACTN|nr:aminoglycoside phosphotransferase family protein [Actinacidiphila paucisporea]SHL43596.1 Predicted kinase, aminoglycoside phosphotransferase (APT) family [Actinacidiphila paucisporea]
MAVHTVGAEAVDGLLARAGTAAERVASRTAMTGGSYNALYEVGLTDGTRLVLKVPPPAGSPRLRYEAELLCGEALFYESAATVGVPAPRVVHAEWSEDAGAAPFLLMSHTPGVSWQEAGGSMAGGERDRLREELGGLVARLHTVRGPGFGYPAQRVAPLAERWAPAFEAMTDAVLADAAAFGSWLPLPAGAIRSALAGGAAALAEVAEPALVHFDLWPGNILLDGAPGARAVSGLIDGERMFWGDPLADFASLSLLSAPLEDDPAFLAGYGAAGGRTAFDDAARVRLALYRCYLYLIMLVEVVPRGTRGEHLAWVRDFTAPRLTAALDTVAGGG